MAIWRDIHPDLKLGADGDIRILEDVAAVYGSIENILRTVTGERVMVRKFPGLLHSLLFEPLRENALKSHAEDELIAMIQAWDDRVKINYLDINVDQDNDECRILVEFYIKGYDQVFQLDKVL